MQHADHFIDLLWPGIGDRYLPPWTRFANRVLRKAHVPLSFQRPFDHREDMVSPEQAANIQLLLGALLDHEVPGDIVELGCYLGNTSAVIASVLHARHAARPFHVYDSFAYELGSQRGIRATFERNFMELGLPLPTIHAGDLFSIVPAELPDRLAFVHIDLGVGGDPAAHAVLITHALAATYPRTAPGGVIILMDYHVPGVTVEGHDSNPGVRIAADAFLRDKPEKVSTLRGGPCSHGYIRKQ